MRTLADGLEHSYGWEVPAAQRLRFLLDFAYATGLRASELVGATLGGIQTDAHGDQWLHLIGKGSKPGKVALPPLARNALDRYLIHRRLPVTPARWNPQTPLIGSLEQDSAAGITGSRLWSIMKQRIARTLVRFDWQRARQFAIAMNRARHWSGDNGVQPGRYPDESIMKKKA